MWAFQAFFDGFNHKKLYPRLDIKDLGCIAYDVREKQKKRYNEYVVLKVKEFEKITQRHKTDA